MLSFISLNYFTSENCVVGRS